MSPSTSCPACGAPIQYTNTPADIRCDFCGTQFSVREEDGIAQVEVLAQPRPQADVLSERADEISEEALDDAVRTSMVDSWGFEGPSGDPIAPGSSSMAATDSEPTVFAADPFRVDVPPTASTIPDTPPYQAGRMDAPAGTGNRSRWIGLGIAVVVGLCLTCACLGALGMSLYQNGAFIF